MFVDYCNMPKQYLLIGLLSGFGLGGFILLAVFLFKSLDHDMTPMTSATGDVVAIGTVSDDDVMPMDHSGHDMMMSVTTERAFLEHMIPHHEEAIMTSELMLDRVQSEEQAEFLRGIINDQTLEVDQMTDWYQDWFGAAYEDVGVYEPMMPDLSAITDDAEAWRAYLDGMIKHHQGAVEMASALLDIEARRELTSLAVTIIRVQNEEIATMQAWLAR